MVTPSPQFSTPLFIWSQYVPVTRFHPYIDLGPRRMGSSGKSSIASSPCETGCAGGGWGGFGKPSSRRCARAAGGSSGTARWHGGCLCILCRMSWKLSSSWKINVGFFTNSVILARISASATHCPFAFPETPFDPSYIKSKCRGGPKMEDPKKNMGFNAKSNFGWCGVPKF